MNARHEIEDPSSNQLVRDSAVHPHIAKDVQSRWLFLGALLVLTLLGLALRVYRLGEVPFGFHTDEGHYASDAVKIVAGWRPIFLPNNNGREPLFVYLMAGIIALFGPSIWSARLTSALVGTAMIPIFALMVRALPVPRPRITALLAAAYLAISFWPVAQARYALRTHLLPLWVMLMLWAWVHSMGLTPLKGGSAAASPAGQGGDGGDSRASADSGDGPSHPIHLRWAVVTGVCLAAAVYTYLTGRLLPFVLIGSGAWVAWRTRRRQPLVALALALLVAGALCLPLANYFQAHPEMLNYRADQVSIFNPEVNEGHLVRTLAENAWNLAQTPFTRGDTSWYHNLKRRPALDPLGALACLAGLLYLARDLLGRRGRRAQSAAVLLGFTLAVTAAPSLLSAGAPNYVRLTGVWPVLFLLPALGLERAAAWVDERWGSKFGRRRGSPSEELGETPSATLPEIAPAGPRMSPGMALCAAVLAVGIALTVRDYFGTYALEPKVYDAFNGAAVERGRQLAEVAAETGIAAYASPALWNQSVIRFLNAGRPLPSFDSHAGLVLPPVGTKAAIYAFDPAESEPADAFARQWPNAERRVATDSHGQTSLTTFRMDADDTEEAALTAGPRMPLVDFGSYLMLEAARFPDAAIHPGSTISLTLRFVAKRPTLLDHNLFMHLDAPDGRTVAQFDGPPLDGSYPTDTWRPGERVLMEVPLELPADAPLGPLVVRIGWYDWRDGERLPANGDAGGAAEVGVIVLSAK